jgi:hypothetical protein
MIHLISILKTKRQDFEGKKWLVFIKTRNCFSKKTTRVLQLPAWNHVHKLTSISRENIQKSNRIRLSMDGFLPN